jgi:predicted transcriptional regulator
MTFSAIFDALFGCAHKRYSFPITAKQGQRRNQAASVTGTYVVCLDCGREFPYDWQEMKFVSANASEAKLSEAAQPVVKSA